MGLVSRRALIAGGLSVAALGAFGYGMWPRMDGYREEVERQRQLLAADPDLRELVIMATLAANGHNTQPWKFRLLDEQICILSDLTRRTEVVDPDDHHLNVSLGCVAENLFAAFKAGDTESMRAVCADDMVASQNKGPSMDLEAQLAFCNLMHAVVQDFHYEDVRRQKTDTGFVSQHVVCGTLPDGSVIRIPACVVGDVSERRITRTVGYMDTGAAAPLIQAISTAISDGNAFRRSPAADCSHSCPGSSLYRRVAGDLSARTEPSFLDLCRSEPDDQKDTRWLRHP